MKKIVLFGVLMLLMAGVVYAKDYSVTKKAGPLEVTLKMDNDPVKAGSDNKTTIEVRDAAGSDLEVASVELYYFMPSMPAMNYGAKAKREGNAYSADIKPTMPGEWKVDVKVHDGKGGLQKAVFEFSAE